MTTTPNIFKRANPFYEIQLLELDMKEQHVINEFYRQKIAASKSMRETAIYVAAMFQISVDELRSASRVSKLVDARTVFARHSHHVLKRSLTQVGDFLNRHHTSALHLVRRNLKTELTQ